MVTRIRSHNNIVARNFIQEQAQSRMKEIVSAAQQTATNSIFVHATPIIYFSQINTPIKCCCREKVVTNNSLPIGTPGTDAAKVELDLTSSLFGSFQSASSVASEMMDDDIDDNDAVETSSSGSIITQSLFGNATECPICFRTGSLPGYQPLGYSRQVFASVNIVDSDGYYVDSSKSVSEINCDDTAAGYVEFSLNVPKVFHDVKVSAYHGKFPIQAKLEVNDLLISSDVLAAFCGKTVSLKICGVSFTHIVVMFQLSKKKFLADFPQDQRPKDYTMFDSTQPVQIVTDNSIPSINSGDIIYKVGYNTFWKVNDYEFYRMNDKTVIGWNITARLLQADEIQQNLLNFG